MKKQNLFFIPFILGIGISLFSCNIENTGNNSTFQNALAVVGWDMKMGGIVIGIQGAFLAAPSLIDVDEGECILMQQFTIDYDNQPSDKYLTATNIVKEIVDQSYLNLIDNPAELGDYSLPLSNVGGVVNAFFQGRFFVGANSKDKSPDFRLIYNPEEEEINGVKNFYLQAKPTSSTPSSSDVSAIHAFNLRSFIQYYGRDTIAYKGTVDEVDLKYIKVNLKYVSKVTDGEPEYLTANETNTPFEIAIFNDLSPW